MRLLFDQNLSNQLCRRVADLYDGSAHVRDLGLRDADDSRIWEYARVNGWVIVSKDADFRQRSFTFGHPPKVIWIRAGNCSTTHIEALLRRNAVLIAAFLGDDEKSILALG